MTRILIFLLWILLITFTVTILLSFDSRIAGEAFGVKFDSPSSIVIGGAIMALLVAIYATHKIKDIMAMPARLRAREKEMKRERGVAALTRGLEAVAVGDAADASHHAKVAQKHLQDLALTRLLSAQAAQLSGDESAAEASFSAMLEAPETEFLGLRGLYAQAMKKGDHEQARSYAERAFALRANAGWAFHSVFDLNLERGAWGDARDVIAHGRRNNLIAADKADRATAALFTASAYESELSGDEAAAQKDAEAALKLAPSFAPAATLAAQIHFGQGKTGKAARILEAAFSTEPHPALIRLYDNLYATEEAGKRAEKLRKLAAINADSREAKLLKARAANLSGDFEAAVATLEPLITTAPDAHAYALMGEAMAGLHGDPIGRGWLERAAAAPRDPRPGAEGAFHFTRSGWGRLVREYMDHARLAPPPLEDPGEAISSEELRLLTAPPAPDVADSTEEAASEAVVIETVPADEPPVKTEAGEAESLPEAEERGEAAPASDEEGERAANAARSVS